MDSVTLFRAVSLAECQSILRMGAFSSIDNGLEGKWFAESLIAAQTWGSVFYADGVYRVVAITVKRSSADQWMRIAMLDGIGPARYATLEQLQGIEIEVMP